MTIEQIIFDCDGVLIDSEIVAAEVMVPVLKSLGQKIEVRHYLSMYSGKTFRDIFDNLDIDPRIEVEMLIKNVEERVYQNVCAIDGIVDVVRSISLPKAVVSNSGLAQINHALSIIELEDQFLDRFSSTIVSRPKPSPEIYLYAAKRLKVSTNCCLVIEDSVSGVTAAVEAGMNVIGFCGGKHITEGHEEKLTGLGAHFIAKNATELSQLLTRLKKNELNLSNS
jgi:HAD superfamily hydrolase (TIGR01509 family)